MQHRCKSHEKLSRVCAGRASSAAFTEVFAGLPQTPKSFWRHLRDSRKHLGKCGGTCAACANVSANAAQLAQPAQTSQQMPWYLRSLRKRLGKCRGTCAACANVSVNAAELARPAQTPKSFSGHLLHSCKRPSPETRRLMLSSNSRYLIGEMASSIQSTALFRSK